ncbi:MAG: hypothetical protein GX294_00945 [Candidatus Cloacimonetes bacterium]|nr:hypothetical protein [Candidatus Cloacimonadota bacterium]
MKNTIRIGVLFLLAGMLLISACVPRLVIQPAMPDVVIAAPSIPVSTVEVIPPGADRHYMQEDDYLIMDEALGDKDRYDWVAIAKMLVPPSENTKNQAQFMRVTDGVSVWTQHYAKTRIATDADLRLGQEVYFSSYWEDPEYYEAPRSIVDSRSREWIKSRIVDTSELYKNLVMIGGGNKVHKNALRVEVK